MPLLKTYPCKLGGIPRTSFGTNVLEEILIHLSALGILPTRLSCRTPYSKFSRCVARTNLQQFIARFLAQKYYTTTGNLGI